MTYPNDENLPKESARENEFAENFVRSASEIAATEKPNPERRDCFSNEAIRQMAHSAKLPDDSVMTHLFKCSECFREYRQNLSSAKQTVAETSVWRKVWAGLSAKPVFAVAGFALLVGLTLFTVWFWRKEKSTELAKNIEIQNLPMNIQTNENKADEKTNRSANRTNSNKSEIVQNDNFPAKNQPPKNESNKPPTAQTVTLVLTENNVLRNADGANRTSEIVLAARQINLSIKLPDDFPDGVYKFKIVDAFGKDLVMKIAAIRNRKLILTNLNLQNLGKRADKLCLQSANDAPDCFDVKIGQ